MGNPDYRNYTKKRILPVLLQSIEIRKDMIPPDWSLSTFNGKKVSLKNFKRKITLLSFWFKLNAPCQKYMKNYLSKWYEKYNDKGLVVISIGLNSMGETAEIQHDFMKKKEYKWINVFDTNSVVAEKYYVYAVPFTVLISKEGKIVTAGRDSSKIEKYLEQNCKKNEESKKTEK